MQILKDGLEAEFRQGKALANAARAAGTKHFVYSSVGSTELKTGVPHFDSKFQIEECIRTSALLRTILRPVFLFSNYNFLCPMIENGRLRQPLGPE